MSNFDLDDETGNEFFEDGIIAAQRKADLIRQRADGAQVEIELTEDTPFRRYVDACRAEGVEALRCLAEIDPQDAVVIAKLQAKVQAYLTVRAWALGQIERSIVADRAIREDSSDHQDD